MDFIFSRFIRAFPRSWSVGLLGLLFYAVVVLIHVQIIQFSLCPVLYCVSIALLIATKLIDRTVKAHPLTKETRSLVGRLGLCVLLGVTTVKYIACYAAPGLVYYCLAFELLINGALFVYCLDKLDISARNYFKNSRIK